MPRPAGDGTAALAAEVAADLRGILPITIAGLAGDVAADILADALLIPMTGLERDEEAGVLPITVLVGEGGAGNLADTLTGFIAGVPSPLRPAVLK